MKADAVFEGGGVKGIGLVGAICCLEEKGFEWYRLAGSSAGAMIAALLAVGYSGKELKEIMINLNYKDFLDKRKLKLVSFVSKSSALFKDKGIYSGDPIKRIMAELLEKKGKIKFKDISINGRSRLKIIASDITQKNMLILPDDISRYGIDPMEFEIAEAVRMSISIPFYFRPIKFNYNDIYSYIVDGGILSNFPIWIFDVDNTPRWPTFGFKLVGDRISYTSVGKTDLISFLLDVVDTMINRNEEIFIKDKDAVRTIFIPNLGVSTVDFDITKEMKLRIFKSGYNSAEKFLNNWDFQKYIQKYRR